jgi:hypothetical protein
VLPATKRNATPSTPKPIRATDPATTEPLETGCIPHVGRTWRAQHIQPQQEIWMALDSPPVQGEGHHPLPVPLWKVDLEFRLGNWR